MLWAWFLCVLVSPASTQSPRFYSDDPIAKEPDSRDASGVQPWDIGLMYELSYNPVSYTHLTLPTILLV